MYSHLEMSISGHFVTIYSIASLMFVVASAVVCDFSRQEMEQCFIDYHSSANRVDPICKVPHTRLARVQLCIKVWEKVFLAHPVDYLRPRDSSHIGRVQTPIAQWNFETRCVSRKVRFFSPGIEHDDMVADTFECPMRQLQFDGFQTMSNFYISYGVEPNSVFYFHVVTKNDELEPKVDETGMIILRIEHWLESLDRIPDLNEEQLLMSTNQRSD